MYEYMRSERPRGILSSADRDYLKNPDSISRQAQYNRREAIIERTQNAIYDLALLKSQLPQNLREDVFDDGRVYNDFSSSLAFLFLGLTDGTRANMSDTEIIEHFVSGAVKSVFEERELMVEDVSVSIDANVVGDLPTVDELENLTLEQAVEQLETGELTHEVLLEYLTQREVEEKIAKGEADEDSKIVSLNHLDPEVFDDEESSGVRYDLRKFSAFSDSDDEEE